MPKFADLFKDNKDKCFYVPIWKERWNTQRLKKRRAEVGQRAYERGYCANAYSDADKSFTYLHKAKKFCTLADLGVSRQDYIFVAGIDLSNDKRPGKVMATIGYNPSNNHKVLCDLIRGKYDDPTFVDKVITSYYKWRHEAILVESNALQGIFLSWLADKDEALPVIPFHTGAKKKNPELGVPSWNIEMETDQWAIPWNERDNDPDHTGEHDCECGWCVTLEEIETHPQTEEEDGVMAIYFAREGLKEFYLEGDFDIIESEDGLFPEDF